MRRSILTSLVVIGAVLALVMGASTFAVFTETNTLTNDPGEGGTALSSGSFDLVLQDGDSTVNLSFSPAGNASCTNMADGDTCSTTFTVTNGGSLEFTYDGDIDETGDDAANCFVASLAVASPNSGNVGAAQPAVSDNFAGDSTHADFGLALDAAGDGGNGDALDPAESDSFDFTVTLTAPAEGGLVCQDLDVFYTVTVTATQSASPQD